ncbi:hypothetical protein SAMN05216474_0331 [Lishizhenia tianjinensis]|uniref:Uncharacterized protein n=1 Tax=Lishizhenia tianjinensis TaxID=477690 RepID=A0A1I6XMW3_9FLAO|nr:hypothetical protein [Lishizhenia tianjinensis]SFT39728.1 hypothetical protein SAMN05216474_0331 [Lishizhenia tianjinensis]
MQIKTIFLSLILGSTLTNCTTESPLKIEPLQALAPVDSLLNTLATPTQNFTVPSDTLSTITGEKGTVIHVDPSQLETMDGSPIGNTIDVKLLELTDQASMLTHNTPTVSNGKMLVTGGAYYINMSAEGKSLKIKEGQGLAVEFPKLTEDEMRLFVGQRDSLGQINWVATKDNFQAKELEEPVEPKEPVKKKVKRQTTAIDAIFDFVDGKELEDFTEAEYTEYQKQREEYEQNLIAFEQMNRTYAAVDLSTFGFINCDRFYEDTRPKVNQALIVQNESIMSARFYAVFKDINSLMQVNYWKGHADTLYFNQLPEGEDLIIIGISSLNQQAQYFEATVKASNTALPVSFKPIDQNELKTKINALNK